VVVTPAMYLLIKQLKVAHMHSLICSAYLYPQVASS